jgi:AhpC/TSA family/Thiol:disulfide interchange protein DsbD, N-terminal
MQLVELQSGLGPNPDIAVVAISYDPIEVLARFAQERGITYPLLSDAGSVVMGRLGLLSDVTDDDLAYWGFERKERHRGLPFPGVFLLDGDGVVTERRFERSHRNRVSSGALLESLGLPRAEGLVVEDAVPGLAIRAATPHGEVYPNQIFSIDLSFRVEDGRHLYVGPTPSGYQALSVEVDGPDGVFWDPPSLPTGNPMTIPGLGESFSVVEGSFEMRIPIHIHESVGDVTLEVVVGFQTCDEVSCDLPGEMRLALALTLFPKI